MQAKQMLNHEVEEDFIDDEFDDAPVRGNANKFWHQVVMLTCALWMLPGMLLGFFSLRASFTDPVASAANREDGIFWLGIGSITLLMVALWVWKRSYVFWCFALFATLIATYLGIDFWNDIGSF